MSETTATAQTIVAIIAASVVVVGAIVLLAVIMLHRERKMARELEKHMEAIQELKKDVDEKRNGHGKQFETLEDLMKPYKKHLLQSAFDLQSRLSQQVCQHMKCLPVREAGKVVHTRYHANHS